MNAFRKLDDTISVASQLDPSDVAVAAVQGFKLIINNRPDGEQPGQATSDEIEAAAAAAGLNYRYLPVTSNHIDEQTEAMVQALASTQGPVLAFCRSGTRSTLLWALASSKTGSSTRELSETAERAGYDLTPILPLIDKAAH